MAQNPTPLELKAAHRVRKQLGEISNVTLWRWVNSPSLHFPQPIKISGRLYFRSNEIDAWIEAQAAVEHQGA